MTSNRSPRNSSHTSASTTILPYNTHSLPSLSSYIRTDSFLIQTDDGRKFDSGINKQQFHFNIDDSSSTFCAYSSPYYNYHHRQKNRSFLKPILAALTIIAILVYLLISEKLQLASFSLAKSSSSSDSIPKPNDATVNPAESTSSLGRDEMTDNNVSNIKNRTKIKKPKMGADDENNMDVDDDELRGMEDDDTINNATSTEVIANWDTPGGGVSSKIDYMDTQFSFENNTMHSNYNTTATINSNDKPIPRRE